MIAQFTQTLQQSIGENPRWLELVNKSPTEDIRSLVIYQSPHSAYAFKISADLPVAPGTLFDLLCDYEHRPDWDRLLVECRVCARLDQSTIILYVRLKQVWPTAQRDLLLLSHTCKLDSINGGGGGGGYLNITKSIEYPSVPEYADQGVVRMHTDLAGQFIQPDPMDPGRSRLPQLADADPRGWIPQGLVQVMMTQSLPRSILRMTQFAKQLPQHAESEIINANGGDGKQLRRHYHSAIRRSDRPPQRRYNNNSITAQIVIWSAVGLIALTAVRSILITMRNK
jgi:hypothetical protein